MSGQNTLILATDYNTIQSKISTVLGLGSGTSGYGQPVSSIQVAQGTPILVSQWTALRNDLLKARNHQTTTDQSGQLTNITNTTTIKESDRAAYNAMADLVTVNQLVTPPSGQGTLADIGTSSRTSPWNGTISHVVTATFANYDAARAFFNTGSNFQFAGSQDGGSNTAIGSKNDSWNKMLSNMGTITFNYNSTVDSGTGTAANNIGYYQLTTTNQLIFTKNTENSTYSPNQYDILAKVNSAGSVITFTIQFADLSGQPNAPYGTDENVDGTLISQVQVYYATGSNVAVALPAVSTVGP